MTGGGGDPSSSWEATEAGVLWQPEARAADLAEPEGGPPLVPLSQADLAEMCGLSRKVVNGHLAALDAAGWIERCYGEIHIRNAAALVLDSGSPTVRRGSGARPADRTRPPRNF